MGTQSSVHLDSTVTHTTFFSHARIRFSNRRALFTRTHTPKQRRKTMARSSSINLTAFALVALVAFSALSVASASSSRSLLQTMDFGSILQNTCPLRGVRVPVRKRLPPHRHAQRRQPGSRPWRPHEPRHVPLRNRRRDRRAPLQQPVLSTRARAKAKERERERRAKAHTHRRAHNR